MLHILSFSRVVWSVDLDLNFWHLTGVSSLIVPFSKPLGSCPFLEHTLRARNTLLKKHKHSEEEHRELKELHQEVLFLYKLHIGKPGLCTASAFAVFISFPPLQIGSIFCQTVKGFVRRGTAQIFAAYIVCAASFWELKVDFCPCCSPFPWKTDLFSNTPLLTLSLLEKGS